MIFVKIAIVWLKVQMKYHYYISEDLAKYDEIRIQRNKLKRAIQKI